MPDEIVTELTPATEDGSDVVVGDAALTEIPDNWKDALPTDLRESSVIQRVKDVVGLAKVAIDTKALVGANTVKLPGTSATPEDWNEFYGQTGRPEDPEQYTVPEDIPLELSEEDSGQLRKLSFDMGLNPWQAANLMREYSTRIAAAQQAAEEGVVARAEEGRKVLQKEWGPAFEEQMLLARSMIRKFDDSGELINVLEETGMGNDPGMIRLFAKVGKAFAEHDILGGGHNTGLKDTPADAKAKMDAMWQKNGAILKNRLHPDYPALNRELRELERVAFSVEG